MKAQILHFFFFINFTKLNLKYLLIILSHNIKIYNFIYISFTFSSTKKNK